MTVAAHATERRKFTPPKAFVEILGGGGANLPFFKELGLNMARYTKVLVRMGAGNGSICKADSRPWCSSRARLALPEPGGVRRESSIWRIRVSFCRNNTP